MKFLIWNITKINKQKDVLDVNGLVRDLNDKTSESLKELNRTIGVSISDIVKKQVEIERRLGVNEQAIQVVDADLVDLEKIVKHMIRKKGESQKVEIEKIMKADIK